MLAKLHGVANAGWLRRFFVVAGLTAALVGLRCGAAIAADPHDAALDAPPAGVSPTTATLSQILAAHDKAAGGQSPAASGIVETWTFTDSGMAGTETLQRSGLNYRSAIESGPFAEDYGQHDGQRWHRDANGFTAPTTALDTRSFYALRVLEDAADPKNDVTVIGQTGGDRPAWVLKIARPGYRHPEWVFYDAANAQVVRVEFVSGRRRVIETYDDFRTTGGISQAWHVHDTDGRPELDDDWHLQSVRRGVAIADSTFEMPPYRPTVSRVEAVTPIADRTTRFGYFIVRLNVAGHGLDFLLDSAAPTSIVDRDVAAELHLPTFGQTTRLHDGTPIGYRTMLPDVDLAGIRFHNFAVSCRTFGFNATPDTRVVGVLGYDFFAANVLHFDFANGRLEALPVASFFGPHPVDGGIEIPLQIDDGTPLVPLYIGDTLTTSVVLDTALAFSLVSGSFAADHETDVHDLGGDRSHQMVPFADDNSYGIKTEVWFASVPHLRFALSDYTDKTVVTGNFPFKIHDRDVDGFIGNDYLQLYDLYFAYPAGRLIVKPNVIMLKLQRHP